MPLTATFDSGHNHFPSENIYFFMNDGNQRIRCGVSELALEILDPKFQRTKCPSEDFLIPLNHLDSMEPILIRGRGLHCGRTRTGRSTTVIT